MALSIKTKKNSINHHEFFNAVSHYFGYSRKTTAVHLVLSNGNKKVIVTADPDDLMSYF